MAYLWAASLLWAFSFGLIKGQLAGLDPVVVAAGRLALAALVFAPLIVRHARRPGSAPAPRRAAALWGVVQFGLMYVLYIASYRYLAAWQVAVFTVTTPLYVVALDDALKRRISGRAVLAALLAVAGALVVHGASPGGVDGRGVALLQGANLCFAAGQLAYRRLRRRGDAGDAVLVGWMHLGAAGAVAAVALVRIGGAGIGTWSGPALASLLYLGVLPTGLGFYLWNRGAARTGPGALAVANNLKVPLAVLTSWLVFGEEAAYARVLAGLAILVLALVVAGPARRRN